MPHRPAATTAKKAPPAAHAPLLRRLRRVRHFALDMDGTIYRGGTLFPCTPGFLGLLRELGLGWTFLTNNCSKSLAAYAAHLRAMGLAVEPGQIHTSAHAAAAFLRAEMPGVRRLFLVGTASLAEELRGAGFRITTDSADDVPDAVLVAFDPQAPWATLGRAAWWISRGVPFLATHPDLVCPTDQPTVIMDCGAACAAIAAATGRQPRAVLGKPDPRMITVLAAPAGCAAEQIAMVGDRLYTDIAMGRRAGAMSILVLSGEATRADAAAAPRRLQPDVITEDLAALGGLLREAHGV